MLSILKNEEVSHNCFVFDAVKFKKILWKSRRIAAFCMLSSSKPEDVSQNSFVFKLADRQVERQTDRQTDRQPDSQTGR